MSLDVRRARRGDGAAIAEVWPSAAAYDADLDPVHFQLPRAGGLAEQWDGSWDGTARMRCGLWPRSMAVSPAGCRRGSSCPRRTRPSS